MKASVYREPAEGDLGLPVEIAEHVHVHVQDGLVCLGFLEKRGYGDSIFKMWLNPDNFADLARAMMHANSEAAIKAFGSALQAGIPEPIKEGKVWTP